MVATGVPNELPTRALEALCEVLDHRIQRTVHAALVEHERRLHTPRGYPKPPTAIPFRKRRIPDSVLAEMVEQLETDPDINELDLATRYDLPPSLVRRDLASYRSRYEIYCETLSLVPILRTN